MGGLFGTESVLLLVIAVELALIYIRLGQKKT
jgi:hypothetical protein